MSVTLEERVAILEAEINLIKNKVESPTTTVKPWWEQITGTFADSPDYDKAMQLGKKYRESLRKTSKFVKLTPMECHHEIREKLRK